MKEPSADHLEPLTILVLDDMAAWRQLVKSFLERELGLSPFVATSGQEALDILKSHPVDVVVSDVNMPEMNGVQFLEQARSLFPKTKIVMMSAGPVASSTLWSELVARGALAVVSKAEIDPTLVDLLRTLKKTG